MLFNVLIFTSRERPEPSAWQRRRHSRQKKILIGFQLGANLLKANCKKRNVTNSGRCLLSLRFWIATKRMLTWGQKGELWFWSLLTDRWRIVDAPTQSENVYILRGSCVCWCCAAPETINSTILLNYTPFGDKRCVKKCPFSSHLAQTGGGCFPYSRGFVISPVSRHFHRAERRRRKARRV